MSRRRSKIATEGVGESTRPGRKRRGRFAKLLFLGGIVAFVTRPQLRGKALDVVFGPEEQFDYESVTEPIVHDIQSEEAETAWPGAAAAPPAADDDDDDAAPAWRLTTTPITGHDAPAVDVAEEEDEGEPAASPWTPPEPAEPQGGPAGVNDGPSWQYSAGDEPPPSSASEPASDPEPEAHESTAPPSSTWPPADAEASTDQPSTPWTASSSEPSRDPEGESEPPPAPWARPSDAFESPAEAPEYSAAPVEPEEPSAPAEPESSASPEEPTALAEPDDGAAASHPPADATQGVPEHAWGVPASESPGVTHTPVPPADEPPLKPAYQRLLATPPPSEPTRPAIGEATPPRSGWWLPRRRREDSEPPQWDWRSE